MLDVLQLVKRTRRLETFVRAILRAAPTPTVARNVIEWHKQAARRNQGKLVIVWSRGVDRPTSSR